MDIFWTGQISIKIKCMLYHKIYPKRCSSYGENQSPILLRFIVFNWHFNIQTPHLLIEHVFCYCGYHFSYVVFWNFTIHLIAWRGHYAPLYVGRICNGSVQTNVGRGLGKGLNGKATLLVYYMFKFDIKHSHLSSVPWSNCSRSALNKLKRLKYSAIAVMEVMCVPTWSLKQKLTETNVEKWSFAMSKHMIWTIKPLNQWNKWGGRSSVISTCTVKICWSKWDVD